MKFLLILLVQVTLIQFCNSCPKGPPDNTPVVYPLHLMSKKCGAIKNINKEIDRFVKWWTKWAFSVVKIKRPQDAYYWRADVDTTKWNTGCSEKEKGLQICSILGRNVSFSYVKENTKANPPTEDVKMIYHMKTLVIVIWADVGRSEVTARHVNPFHRDEGRLFVGNTSRKDHSLRKELLDALVRSFKSTVCIYK